MAPDVEAIEVNEIEVGGELVDEQGNRWAVPADNLEDLDDLGASNPLAFPADKTDPRFHYQWIRLEEWPEYRAKKFVRVTVEEMGGMPGLSVEYGKELTSYLEYAGAIAVKAPKFVVERLHAQKEAKRRLAIQDTEPTEEMLEKAGGHRVISRTMRSRTIEDEPASPAPRRSRK